MMKTKFHFGLLFMSVLLIMSTQPAFAKKKTKPPEPPAAAAPGPQCAPHDQLAAVLGHQYHEFRRNVGIISEGALMEIYRSEEGTWSFVITTPDMNSCMLAAGEAWQEMPSPAEQKGPML